MNITITKEFRGLKSGDVYSFPIDKTIPLIVVVGENGCGKSSLLQALRGYAIQNKYTKSTNSLFESDYIKLASNIQVEHSYTKIFALDVVTDNGLNFMNAADASSFIHNGGYAKAKVSHGQGSMHDLVEFYTKNKDHFQEGTLAILDEVDHGLALGMQAKFIRILDKITSSGCHVLMISHNPFLISSAIICYDFANKTIELSKSYIEKTTGFTVHRTPTL